MTVRKRPTQNEIKAIIRSAFNDGAYAMINIQQRAAVDAHYAQYKEMENTYVQDSDD